MTLGIRERVPQIEVAVADNAVPWFSAFSTRRPPMTSSGYGLSGRSRPAPLLAAGRTGLRP